MADRYNDVKLIISVEFDNSQDVERWMDRIYTIQDDINFLAVLLFSIISHGPLVFRRLSSLEKIYQEYGTRSGLELGHMVTPYQDKYDRHKKVYLNMDIVYANGFICGNRSSGKSTTARILGHRLCGKNVFSHFLDPRMGSIRDIKTGIRTLF